MKSIVIKSMIKKLLTFIVNMLISILKQIEGLDNYTARPRELTLDQGTVSLQGFPKETADALSQHIKNFGKQLPVVEASLPAEVTPSLSAPMLDKTVGVRHNVVTNKYEVVTLIYNIDTKESAIEKIEIFDFKRDALTKFKMIAYDLHFT